MEIKKEPKDDAVLQASPLSYYRSTTVSAGGRLQRAWQALRIHILGHPVGRPVDALELRFCMNGIYDRHQNSILIVENGLGVVDRVEADMVECIGYIMWGSIVLTSLSTGELKEAIATKGAVP